MNAKRTAHPFLYFVIALQFMLTAPTFGQNSKQDTRKAASRDFHREIPDNEFIPVDQERQTSQAYRISSDGFTSVQVNVDSLGRNILGDAANEPTIAIDPTNPNRIAIGWRQFNTVASNFRQAGYAFTTDGGLTWKFPGVIEPGIFRSDPVFDSDDEGNFYYNSLTSNGAGYSCMVFKSTTGGASWNAGTFAYGGDKQWMTIDKTNSAGNGHHYADWTSSFSACPPGFFTRSTNDGDDYESCTTIPEDPYWGTLAVGPAGELYVCGVSGTGFVVAKSTSARDSSHAVLWDTSAHVNLDGEVLAFAGSNSPNPGGLHGQAWVAVDNSNGVHRGNVYVLCSVARTSNTDPLDVMFARSTDGGRTWSVPVRVNDDSSTTAWQWFGTMSVAPTGRIDVVWLDTRDNPGNINSSLYYSYSNDGGATWSVNARLSQSFDPHLGWPQQDKMGDYFHMISDDAGAHLAWAATFGGEQNVYYGRITLPLTSSDEQHQAPVLFSLSQNYPNPFNPSTQIKFSVDITGPTRLDVFNVLGQKVQTLFSGIAEAGFFNTVELDGTLLPSGVYYYRLESGKRIQVKKLLLLK